MMYSTVAGWARQGRAGPGSARQGRQGVARRGGARQARTGSAGLGAARRGLAGMENVSLSLSQHFFQETTQWQSERRSPRNRRARN